MDTDRKWVVVRIDGKIASVSTDYKALADITARIAAQKSPAYDRICAEQRHSCLSMRFTVSTRASRIHFWALSSRVL